MDWFFSYSHQMVPGAQAVKDALYAALGAHGWGINGQPPRPVGATHRLLDDGGLLSGDFWPNQLLDWLHSCKGGILFFTEDLNLTGEQWQEQIVQRRWLYIEAFMLIAQKVRGQLDRCVPIFVDTDRDRHPVAQFVRRDWPGLHDEKLSVPVVPAELAALIAVLQAAPVGPAGAVVTADADEEDPFETFIRHFVDHVGKEPKERAVKIALKGSANPAMLATADLNVRLEVQLEQINGGRHLPRDRLLNLAVAEIVIGGPMQGEMRCSPAECANNYRTILRHLVDGFHLAIMNEADYGEHVQRGRVALRTKWVSTVAMRGVAASLCEGAHIFIIADTAILDGGPAAPAAPAENLAILDELVEAGKCLGSTDVNANLSDFSSRIGNLCKLRERSRCYERLASTVYDIEDRLRRKTSVYHLEEQEAGFSQVIADVGELLTERRDAVDPVVVVDTTGYLLANARFDSAPPRRGDAPRDATAGPRTRLDVLVEASRKHFPFDGLVGPSGEAPYNPLYIFAFASDLSRGRLAELGRAGAQIVPIDLAWRAKIRKIIN